ncbi:aldehyde dehydrogenase [Frankia sp. CNm7]|uniref:aldehyde dehydrogenase (NAD(+)) n=1 Tax=Frankia nepalensis TaxID=1836974 RepID=A0A937RNG0_9ACTN|nr:aldehyde dehydrogenase [Frankia nepalensis]MBL7495843.1 aldehyde dehydrogenase [Frankia nepalensis]MBL7509919.1 aldehyde dehydrogenase [Frankia nepalensis]MBL7523696.1 aldehyde dehydrogenase [Frankia nepalensis]MBL7629678.1 aldehyde dehydrogenase [Frankia nepalensis]
MSLVPPAAAASTGSTIVKDRLFIGGEWLSPASGRTIKVISPHTEEVIATVPEADGTDIDRAVAAARAAFEDGPWPRTSPAERAAVIRAVSAGIQARMQEFSDTVTAEMGAPSTFALFGNTLAATTVLDGYAELLDTFRFEEERAGILGPVLVTKAPVGVCAGIVPWNVPLFLIAMKIGASLASGSTMVIKSAPETPLTGYLLAEVLESVGLPPGVINIITADRENSELLVRHPGLDKVSFTGSTAVGRRIGAICGEQLKRCTLELGGKSAAILLDDADLGAALPALLSAAFLNTGQVCAAQTRVLAPRSRYQEVVDGLADLVGGAKVGDPADPETLVGPLVAARQRDRVEGLIHAGVDEGARLVRGGGRPAALDRGWYVEPTLFADVDNRMRIAQEEIFGPVLSVIPFDGEDEAVRIANDSAYGLSGSVWTGDPAHGAAVGRRVRTGVLAVNSGTVVDPKNPFGGFKQSGIGRELGPEGLEAYLETQSIVLPKG